MVNASLIICARRIRIPGSPRPPGPRLLLLSLMSALKRITDLSRTSHHVRKVPTTEVVNIHLASDTTDSSDFEIGPKIWLATISKVAKELDRLLCSIPWHPTSHHDLDLRQ